MELKELLKKAFDAGYDTSVMYNCGDGDAYTDFESFYKSEIKQLTLTDVGNSTSLQQLFNKCKQDDPTMTKNEFNEALDLWLYRWEKDQQIKQMRSEL